MADDDVQLTDLEVIQRYSLAVRGATASRAELVAALQADLAWLQGTRSRSTSKSTPRADAEGERAAVTAPAKKAPTKAATKRKA